jgi:hypothetical protein
MINNKKRSDLLTLAQDRPIPKEPFESAVCYGMGKALKQYVNYPDKLPLCFETDHGPSLHDKPIDTELQTSAPLMLFHNKRVAKSWKTITSKPCAVMGSPFAYFRKLYGINKKSDATGTVVFPWHSTPLIHAEIQWDEYCEKLKELHDMYQPITICIYWRDVLKGLHKIFTKAGFSVVTAGHMYDDSFTERFYNILSRHKYATSNLLQSCTFYAVEMGIPFFLYGETKNATSFNSGDPNVPLGRYCPVKTYKRRVELSALFRNITKEITKEQKNAVEEELGIHDALGPKELRRLLWLAYYQYNSIKNNKKILVNIFKLSGDCKGTNAKDDLKSKKVLIFRSSSVERFNTVLEWVIANIKPNEVIAILQKDVINSIKNKHINKVVEIEPGKIEWRTYGQVLNKNIVRDDKFDMVFPCTDDFSPNYKNLLYIAYRLKPRKVIFKSEDKMVVIKKREILSSLIKIKIINIVHILFDKCGVYSLIHYFSKKRLINLTAAYGK